MRFSRVTLPTKAPPLRQLPQDVGRAPEQLLAPRPSPIHTGRGREAETTSKQEWFLLAPLGEALRPGWEAGRNVMASNQGGVQAAPRGLIASPPQAPQSPGKGSHWSHSVPHWPVRGNATVTEAPGTTDPPSPPHIPSQHRKIAPLSHSPNPGPPPSPLPSTSHRAAGHSCLAVHRTRAPHLRRHWHPGLYIYYGNFPMLEEGVPFPYSHKGATGLAVGLPS